MACAKSESRRVAVYGGTFDPPHSTHLLLARTVLDRGLAEHVLFVPAADPPHKTGQTITPFVHRMRMLELAVKGEPRFELSGIEAERLPKLSYTIDTMAELSACRPADTFLLLIGSDSLDALHTWHRASELVERHEFIVYPRKGSLPTLEGLKANWPGKVAGRLFASIIQDVPQTDLSSTCLRSALANSGNAGRFIPEAVMAYIRANGLYEKTKTESNADGSSEERR